MNETEGASLLPKPYWLKRVYFDQGLTMATLLNCHYLSGKGSWLAQVGGSM
jgi:hypothetical protein